MCQLFMSLQHLAYPSEYGSRPSPRSLAQCLLGQDSEALSDRPLAGIPEQKRQESGFPRDSSRTEMDRPGDSAS